MKLISKSADTASSLLLMEAEEKRGAQITQNNQSDTGYMVQDTSIAAVAPHLSEACCLKSVEIVRLMQDQWSQAQVQRQCSHLSEALLPQSWR